MWGESNKISESPDPDQVQGQGEGLSPRVLQAISKVLPCTHPLDQLDFDLVTHINHLLPTEESLNDLPSLITSVEDEICQIDHDLRELVRVGGHGHNHGDDGDDEKGLIGALHRAQTLIQTLGSRVTKIKGRAGQTEVIVREMTRDIRYFDTAKKNLSSAITTLNHLNMLIGGVETLGTMVQRRQYGDIINLLQGVTNVAEHFNNYQKIPQIAQLSQKLVQIKEDLGAQVTTEFHDYFKPPKATLNLGLGQLHQICQVLEVLPPIFKHEVIQWFIQFQLQEYHFLFNENEDLSWLDLAWLDKIDKRYDWLKKHLILFEEKYSGVFPAEWDISERIATQFCTTTRNDLANVMGKRRDEIGVRLLLNSIQRTESFEHLLWLRFGGVHAKNLNQGSRSTSNKFNRMITQCFDAFLDIYIESQEKNLRELIDKFVSDLRQDGFPTPRASDSTGIVLPNSADLFVFYKKSMVQCTELGSEEALLDLGHIFKKGLRDYCGRILGLNLPRKSMFENIIPCNLETQSSNDGQRLSDSSLRQPIGSIAIFISRITCDFNAISLIQNFQSFLKDEDSRRFSRQEIYQICCILVTTEYCFETTHQLEEKLRDKLIGSHYSSRLDMSGEKEMFKTLIETCTSLLVQDLYSAIEPALNSMRKVNWDSLEAVGDQSGYVSAITSQWLLTIPTLRDFLGVNSRKYFVLICQQFVELFLNKYLASLYKCKNVGKTGAQQLLLDTQCLKASLLDLPSIGLSMKRKPPEKYSTLILQKITRIELILKLIMIPIGQLPSFVKHFRNLVPDCELDEFMTILEMRGHGDFELRPSMEEFNTKISSESGSRPSQFNMSRPDGDPKSRNGGLTEFSPLLKLEKLIKNACK